MNTAFFRNILCVAGLFLGTALITGADLARAGTQPCTEEQLGPVEENYGLPIICEVFTITATRTGREETFAGPIDIEEWLTADIINEVRSEARSQNWRGDVTS